MLFASCGGSNEERGSSQANPPDTSPSSEPDVTPSTEAPKVSELAGTFLHPGRYKTDLFKPSFTFKAPALAYPFTAEFETENHVEFVKGPAYQAIVLTRPTKMYASDNVSLENAPSNPLDWFKDSEYLTTSAGPKVTVGDVTAPSIHVQVSSIPDDQPVPDCSKCVAILPSEGAPEPLIMGKADQLRVAQVEVAGDKVLVILFTPKSDFGIFIKIGANFLENISWKK